MQAMEKDTRIQEKASTEPNRKSNPLGNTPALIIIPKTNPNPAKIKLSLFSDRFDADLSIEILANATRTLHKAMDPRTRGNRRPLSSSSREK